MPRLEQRLFDEPYAFDFFQAVRLLNRLEPTRMPVGYWGPPESESVRFRSLISHSFPPSAIADLERPDPGHGPPLLTQAFFGLTGPSGVLPRHYTDLLLRLKATKGPERTLLRDWLDLFNHRLLSHFQRAWEKYRLPIAYERWALERERRREGGRDRRREELDPFTEVLFSLVGLGMPSLRGRLVVSTGGFAAGLTAATATATATTPRTLARVEDLALAYYAGLLAHRPRNAIGLEAMAGDYFGLPARVSQFVGQWLVLEPVDQTRLGIEGGHNRLGNGAVVGDRVWDVQGKIRIRLGPLRYAQFVEFLPDRAPVPDRKALFLLAHLVRFYVGEGLDFDVQLVLLGHEVPECLLEETQQVGPRLGWNTWLRSEPLGHDTDAIFEGVEVFSVDGTWGGENLATD